MAKRTSTTSSIDSLSGATGNMAKRTAPPNRILPPPEPDNDFPWSQGPDMPGPMVAPTEGVSGTAEQKRLGDEMKPLKYGDKKQYRTTRRRMRTIT